LIQSAFIFIGCFYWLNFTQDNPCRSSNLKIYFLSIIKFQNLFCHRSNFPKILFFINEDFRYLFLSSIKFQNLFLSIKDFQNLFFVDHQTFQNFIFCRSSNFPKFYFLSIIKLSKILFFVDHQIPKFIFCHRSNFPKFNFIDRTFPKIYFLINQTIQNLFSLIKLSKILFFHQRRFPKFIFLDHQRRFPKFIFLDHQFPKFYFLSLIKFQNLFFVNWSISKIYFCWSSNFPNIYFLLIIKLSKYLFFVDHQTFQIFIFCWSSNFPKFYFLLIIKLSKILFFVDHQIPKFIFCPSNNSKYFFSSVKLSKNKFCISSILRNNFDENFLFPTKNKKFNFENLILIWDYEENYLYRYRIFGY
jgi:hypothetical protein